MFKRVSWSPVEEEWLRNNKDQKINQQCIQLNKSRTAIKNKLCQLEGGEEIKKGKISYIGKRVDCDSIFMRSRWEANFFRYLRKNKDVVLIEYEPVDFLFTEWVKKGTVTYTPDFRVTYRDGNSIWVEVKGGFLKPSDKTKLRRFKKYYPSEFSKLVALSPSQKNKTTVFFTELGVPVKWYYNELQKNWKKLIPGWEG